MSKTTNMREHEYVCYVVNVLKFSDIPVFSSMLERMHYLTTVISTRGVYREALSQLHGSNISVIDDSSFL